MVMIMELAKVLINKLSKKQLALLCDSYECGDFDYDIIPELIEQDAKNRPAAYGMAAHLLEKNKTASRIKRHPGFKEIFYKKEGENNV